jgi:hypothetical protein
LAQAKAKRLLLDEHFTVDGTLIEAWVCQKSFKLKTEPAPVPLPDNPGNPIRGLLGERRTNAMHASTTNLEARLHKPVSQKARLCFLGHVLMENQRGFVVNAMLTLATRTAEREAVFALVSTRLAARRITLGGDKNYNIHQFVHVFRAVQVPPPTWPHTTNRTGVIDGWTTRHLGYTASQQTRKRVDAAFGWLKMVGVLLQFRWGSWFFIFAAPCTTWCGCTILRRLGPSRCGPAVHPQGWGVFGLNPVVSNSERFGNSCVSAVR